MIPDPDHVFDGGDMDCGSGLILLIRQHILLTPEGGVLELRSQEPTVCVELPPWCRLTGHGHLATVEDTPGHWRHFLQRSVSAPADTAVLEADLARARDYEWRLRVRSTGNQEATVYARNFSWKVGQPTSFEERDEHPSALESAMGALAADLVNTFATLCRQRGHGIDELEATVKGSLADVLAHLGMEEGKPSIARMDVTGFITSPAQGADLRETWEEALCRSLLFQTLLKACPIATRLVIL